VGVEGIEPPTSSVSWMIVDVAGVRWCSLAFNRMPLSRYFSRSSFADVHRDTLSVTHQATH
jgi:hypothetical protein